MGTNEEILQAVKGSKYEPQILKALEEDKKTLNGFHFAQTHFLLSQHPDYQKLFVRKSSEGSPPAVRPPVASRFARGHKPVLLTFWQATTGSIDPLTATLVLFGVEPKSRMEDSCLLSKDPSLSKLYNYLQREFGSQFRLRKISLVEYVEFIAKANLSFLLPQECLLPSFETPVNQSSEYKPIEHSGDFSEIFVGQRRILIESPNIRSFVAAHIHICDRDKKNAFIGVQTILEECDGSIKSKRLSQIFRNQQALRDELYEVEGNSFLKFRTSSFH